MAGRTRYEPPKSARLNAEQIKHGIERLENLVSELHGFDVTTIRKRHALEIKALEKVIEGKLSSVFGHNTVEFNRYKSAAELDNRSPTMASDFGWGARQAFQRNESHEAQEDLRESIGRSVLLLQSAITWLRDEVSSVAEPPDSARELAEGERLRKVFIVHGHDTAARETVARFVEKLGFEAVILSEQANQGKTVIEKVEAHGEVGFAVVLLTPDDEGCKRGDAPKPRPRQNVLLELGYFIGRLGRPLVCALATNRDIELPTDLAGVIWEFLDNAGGWKQSLARELKAARFEIDWNKVMAD